MTDQFAEVREAVCLALLSMVTPGDEHYVAVPRDAWETIVRAVEGDDHA
jgi:hypothetical protein